MQSTILKDPPSKPSLMTLPPEIRDRIYNEVLGPSGDPAIYATAIHDPKVYSRLNGDYGTTEVDIRSDNSWPVSCHFVKPSILSILLGSKQIYTEAFHIFYSKNRFHFPDTQILYRFLRNIGYVRRQHLTMISFNWRGAEAKEAFRILKTCRRLKSLHFTAPCSEPPGYAAIREIRGLKEAKAIARTHYLTHQDRGTYSSYYACLCGIPYHQARGPLHDLPELERAMMQPRLKQYALDPNEQFDLFKEAKREVFKKPEEQQLFEDRTSFLLNFV